eukprot:scaffold63803_cov58-Phaeocystis_antarctica.AAC.2
MGACCWACRTASFALTATANWVSVKRCKTWIELELDSSLRRLVSFEVNPALEIAELVLCVQAAPVGVWGRRLQGHHELVIHGTVDAAAIDDVDGHRAAGGVGRPSANASDQEGEEHLEVVVVEKCACTVCGGCGAECGVSRGGAGRSFVVCGEQMLCCHRRRRPQG